MKYLCTILVTILPSRRHYLFKRTEKKIEAKAWTNHPNIAELILSLQICFQIRQSQRLQHKAIALSWKHSIHISQDKVTNVV